jgi:purine-nucleoside phosphorylase
MSYPAQAAAEIIKSRHNLGNLETAVILDRSFYGLADIVEGAVSIPYADLPGFPDANQVPDGQLIVGLVETAPVVFFKGRANFYETGDPSLMSSAIETLTHLGARCLMSTSLAVSARADLVPSSLVAVVDHINFNGLNPLIGTANDKNFANMNEAYDKRLLRRMKQASGVAGVTLQEGVLMWFSGPTFETPAEVKMARQLGADLLGWSLAPESIIARRFAIPFAGLAVITDFGAGFSNGHPVADFSRGASVAGIVALKRLTRAFIKNR